MTPGAGQYVSAHFFRCGSGPQPSFEVLTWYQIPRRNLTLPAKVMFRLSTTSCAGLRLTT